MIIAAFNPKGGTGKTTTVVNIGATLASLGKTVLIVDLEADLNASISLGVRPSDVDTSIAELLRHHARPTDAIREISGIPNLFLITGSPALAHIDAALRNARQPERRLADVIKPLATQFDVVLLDSPAGYSLLPASVPMTADELIVPVRAEYLSLESLAQLLRWYRDRRAERKASAHLTGILLTMADYRLQATREIVDIIRLHNRRGVFESEIPLDPRAAEAPSHGIPLVAYAPRARASLAYGHATAELLKRAHRRAR